MNINQLSSSNVLSQYFGYNKTYVTTAFGNVLFVILSPQKTISVPASTTMIGYNSTFTGNITISPYLTNVSSSTAIGNLNWYNSAGSTYLTTTSNCSSIGQTSGSVSISSNVTNQNALHTTLYIDKHKMLLELFSYSPVTKTQANVFLDDSMNYTTISEESLSEFRFVESNLVSFLDAGIESSIPCMRVISALENYYVTPSAKVLLSDSISKLGLSSAELLASYVLIIDKRETLDPVHVASIKGYGVKSSREYIPLQLDTTKSTQSILDVLTQAICSGIPTKYSVIQLLHSLLDNSTDIDAVEFFYSVLEDATMFRYTVSQPHVAVLLYLYEVIQKNFDASV